MYSGQAMYCMNCEQILKSCEETFLPMCFIHDTIKRRNLPFVSSLYSLLGMNLIDGMQNFADLIMESKLRFEEYNTLEIQLTVDNLMNQTYVFKDTFKDWINNEIPAKDVEFKPTAIIQMASNMFNFPANRTADNWTYDETSGVFFTIWTNFRLQYYTHYPMIVDLSDSSPEIPVWSKTSGVYLIRDPDFFFDQASYCVLKRIEEYASLINLEGFNSQLKLDNAIKRLEERVEENRLKTSNLYSKWRNR
jgi:hypothetical protein